MHQIMYACTLQSITSLVPPTAAYVNIHVTPFSYKRNMKSVVVGGGGSVSEDLTSLIVSCAICPDGFTSKLLDSSDFFPPLPLT